MFYVPVNNMAAVVNDNKNNLCAMSVVQSSNLKMGIGKYVALPVLLCCLWLQEILPKFRYHVIENRFCI